MLAWELGMIALMLGSLIGLGGFIYYARRTQLLDIPNARSAHVRPVPKGGGIVFMGLWLLYLLWHQSTDSRLYFVLFPPLLVLIVLGFWDDKRPLSPKVRLLWQGLCAGYLVYFSGVAHHPLHLFSTPWSLGIIGAILVTIGIIWSTNLFNFMDGLDGLATTEGICVLGAGGGLLAWYGAWDLAQWAWLLSASLLGFLAWNWSPARVFMGSVGSYGLGFVIAAFAVLGDIYYQVPLAWWVLLYSVFWFDATVTLLRRVYRKQVWYHPHRLHAYQRLHQSGLSPRQIALGLVMLNACLCAVTYAIVRHWISGLFGTALILGLIYLVYIWVERRRPMLVVG